MLLRGRLSSVPQFARMMFRVKLEHVRFTTTTKASSVVNIADLRLPSSSREHLIASGIKELLPIQSATISELREGVDVIARAKTGSGKTLAFLIPIMEKLSDPQKKRNGKISALILEPTRELALQVARVAQSFRLPVRTSVVYGGDSMSGQKRGLDRGCDIVIATPGRLVDFLDRNWIDFSSLETLVVDEADRLLDMGFHDDLVRIFERLPASRQSVLFSATLPDWTRSLAKSYMRSNQVVIDLVQDEVMSVPEQVRHVSAMVSEGEPRHAVAEEAIEWAGGGRSLVFASTKKEVEEIASQMSGARALHGGMLQKKREWILNGFRRGVFNTLVATDVAARGLDISNVKTVVHLRPTDVERHPFNVEDYVHRAGRVGRAGQEGTSVLVHTKRDTKGIARLEKEIGIRFDRSAFVPTKTVVEKPEPARHERRSFRGEEDEESSFGGGNRRSSSPRRGSYGGDRRSSYGGGGGGGGDRSSSMRSRPRRESREDSGAPRDRSWLSEVSASRGSKSSPDSRFNNGGEGRRSIQMSRSSSIPSPTSKKARYLDNDRQREVNQRY